MVECRACTRRFIRAIAGDVYRPRLLSQRALALTPRQPQNGPQRHTSTAGATATEPGVPDALVAGRQPVETRHDLDPEKRRQTKAVSTTNEKHLKFELQYLGDRVKLAQHVRYTLERDMPEKALDLVRLASKESDCIVSWNHIIDYHLQRKEVDQAMKIYNEMKKRAQFPDGHTYSILLSGLALPKHQGALVPSSNVTKALSIYYSMSSPTSRTKPNIIHTNNVLKVCKEAADMDSLWAVVSKLSDEGSNAPDHITYAILLNAIRHGAFGNDEEGIPLNALRERRMKAVHEGRAIWRDVITKWRAGQVLMDEMLVIAMGKLLMMSDRIEDWDDVLNLVNQTMNIPRQLPALGSPERHIEHVPQDNDLRIAAPESAEDESGFQDSPALKAFLPVKPHTKDSAFPNRPSELAFVKPGPNTLSILIGACENLRSPKAALAYWELLTSTDGVFVVTPVLSNFHTLLKLLGKNRASAKALNILRSGLQAWKIQPTAATFRIAMSICMRDKNNPNVLDNARQILDEMETALADPDVLVARQFMDLALLTNDGPKIVFSINRLDTIVNTFRSRVLYGDLSESPKSKEHHLREVEEILHFLSSHVGAIDALTRRGLVPASEHSYWQGRRATLDAFILHNTRSVARAYERLEAESGEKVLRRKDLMPRKGMAMDKEEFGRRRGWFEQKKEKREALAAADRKNLVAWRTNFRRERGKTAARADKMVREKGVGWLGKEKEKWRGRDGRKERTTPSSGFSELGEMELADKS